MGVVAVAGLVVRAAVGIIRTGRLVGHAINHRPVRVTHARSTVDSQGARAGYFGPATLTSCNGCRRSLVAGGVFVLTVSLTNPETASAHTVTALTVAAPFTLDAPVLGVPFHLASGTSRTIALTLRAPSSGGTYTLRGTVVTDGPGPARRGTGAFPHLTGRGWFRPATPQAVAQFFAYVYPERNGFRVAVEGIADVHADSLADADRKARAVIRRAVYASHPDRVAEPSPAATALLELELRVVRLPARDPPGGPGPRRTRRRTRTRR